MWSSHRVYDPQAIVEFLGTLSKDASILAKITYSTSVIDTVPSWLIIYPTDNFFNNN